MTDAEDTTRLRVQLAALLDEHGLPTDQAAPLVSLARQGRDLDPAAIGAALVRILRPTDYPDPAARLVANVVEGLAEPESGEALRGTLSWVLGEHPVDASMAEVVRIARQAPLAEDACISIAEPAWRDQARFAQAYDEATGIAAWGRDIRWRVQTLVKLAAASRHVRGDFVECGVDTGGTARAVLAYLGDEEFADRTFWLFDTFRGLVPEQLDAEERALEETRGDRYPDVADVARANFADKPYVRIVQGAVPDTLAEFEGDRVAFLHIDMNATVPEVGALRHFWPLLSPGAPVVFDDYGFPRHAPQRRALDAVADELGVEILMLPTCQGVLIKPPATEG